MTESVVAESVEVKKKEAKPKAKKAPVHSKSFIGTGRRKTAVARVKLVKGTGKITVNSVDYKEYFINRALLISCVLSPLKEIGRIGDFDVVALVRGGGVPAQADALRMGIARALVEFDIELRKILRPVNLLMRDPRMKERKKYGLKRARRAFQYTKR